MQRSGVLDGVGDVRKLSLSAIPTREAHGTAVMVEPRYFDRVYKINPYMEGSIDRDRARTQWEHLRETLESCADDVRVLDPRETQELVDDVTAPLASNRPDMVFVANHALPTPTGEGFVLARMATDERAGEPRHFAAWARRQGYDVATAPAATFEGMGDALWHPGRELLWGGYGVRSEREAYDELVDRLDVPLISLELTSEYYYHLDVSLAPLSESTALVQPEAFTDDALAKIAAVFETVLEAPPAESTAALAVNLEVFDGTVVLGTEAPETTQLLEGAGFDVVTVDTGEFQKAGGSVCCLTLTAGTPS